MIVSIHAPTRGATRRSGSTIGCYRIVSIHAPTRGATQQVLGLSRAVRGFNPRTHTGCDDASQYAFQKRVKFQSTHPHGVRLSKIIRLSVSNWFQSTHPHGVRLSPCYPLCSCEPRFNPRTHTGCDSDDLAQLANTELFQSTHPHGVRLELQDIIYISAVSIHAPTRGATPLSMECYTVRIQFQSTHPHGVRLMGATSIHVQAVFQSTHPHGVRPCIKLHIISQ